LPSEAWRQKQKSKATQKKNSCGMLESGLILSLLCQDIG
jgi:hypothetical protein